MELTRRQLLQATGIGAGLGMGLRAGPLLAAGTDTVRKPYQMQRLVHGVAYYPELWPEEDIDKDIAEMRKLGINVVRMGEFAWSSFEPQQGKVSFDLFARVMDKMQAAGIGVVLCTPSATPPIWLTDGHPERCHKDENGVIMSHGARQHASYFHPIVKQACFRIIKQMAETLGKHPALVGWQLDNEIKCHVAEDFSDAAIAAWHPWLKQRFGRIEKLNEAWGTHVWSQYYQRFEQVPAPFKTPFLHNASLSTAYKMFCREGASEFLFEQRQILRRYSSAPITHNDNPAFNLHHEKQMEALDFASYDAYPNDKQWGSLVFRSDLYRAAIPGRPFWLMETSVSHNGWLGNHQPPHPEGFLAAESVLVYGLGGEAFCYWLWRQQRSGAELPHSAVLSAWHEPSIGYSQVLKVNETRQQLEPLLVEYAMAPAEIAVTFSDHARAMLETENLDKRDGFPSRYRDVVAMWHSQVQQLGYHRDVRFENASLDGLKLLITPAMPYVSPEFLHRVMEFVQQGGIWIAGPVTGTRGKEHTVPTDAGLGLLDDFAGVHTRFVVPLTNTGTEAEAFDQRFEISGWCAAMTPKPGTKVMGMIRTGVAAGNAFLTERMLGKGKVVVLGAQPHGEQADGVMQQVIKHYAQEAGVAAPVQASKGIVVSPRINSQGKPLWVAINMQPETGELSLPAGARDAISGEKLGLSVSLNQYKWRAIQFSL